MIDSTLFIGFSVTEDSNGYVEEIQKNELSVSKVGIGGIQPHHLIFFIDEILERSEESNIVLELSTAGFRTFLSKQMYFFSVCYLISRIIHYNKTPLLLDLPRAGVDYSVDWVVQLNNSICKELDILHINLCETLSGKLDVLLRDGVHTTGIGAKEFAKNIIPVLKQKKTKGIKSDNLIFRPLRGVKLLCKKNEFFSGGTRFSRGGFNCQYETLNEDGALSYDAESFYCLGLAFIISPRSSAVTVSSSKTTTKLVISDEYAYYSRFSTQYFNQHVTGLVKVSSTFDFEHVKLKKGERPVGLSQNDIVGVLCSSVEKRDMHDIGDKLLKILETNDAPSAY